MRVVFHMTPNGNQEQRCWDKWAELAERLVGEHDVTIYVVGGRKDSLEVLPFLVKTDYLGNRVKNLVGQTTLDQLIALVRSCDLLVCVNSFVMHLGVALGVKMFAIVGATEPKVVLPPGIPHAYSLYARDIPLETVLEGIR